MGSLAVFLSLAALLGLQLYTAEAADCACATTGVNMRSGAGTWNAILGLLRRGSCVPYKGRQRRGGSYTWANVDFNGRDAWIATNFINIRSCGGGAAGGGCPRILSRAQWGARPPRSSASMRALPRYVFIHHGASPPCSSQSTCASRVRSYQTDHMNEKGWLDIGYSFVVGEDGNVYEGRGWTVQGGHTKGYNSIGIGICVIGDFSSRPPNLAAQQAVQQLIQCGVSQGRIRSDYRLLGHRDVSSTSCPGNSLYALIQSWAHYGR